MKKKHIDVRGLSCPLPVVRTKEVLEEVIEWEVIAKADNPEVGENIKRMAEGLGWGVEVVEGGDEVKVLLKKSHQEVDGGGSDSNSKGADEGEVAYLFAGDYVGQNRELGKVLLKGFLDALVEVKARKKMVFINTGVKLTVDGSYVIEPLRKLEQSGAEMLICGTCLDFFKIGEKTAVGRRSNALEIMESLTYAFNVIRF